jgi:hypothetical protein
VYDQPSESLALSSAVAFLAGHYGSLTEYPHRCEDFGHAPVAAAPIVLSGL